MHYITKEKLIEALQQLPSGTEIVNIGRVYKGRVYKGSTPYFVIDTNGSEATMEIKLDRRDNNAD